MSELPTGWAGARLADVMQNLDSRRVPVNRTERAKRPGTVPYYGATGQVGWIDEPLFDEELVLVGEDGAPFLDRVKPKAYVIDGPSWVNNHAHVLRALAGVTSNRFLKHALDAVDYEPFVNGTTRLKLTKGALNGIPIPLPPLNEQRRIVAAIEEQLSRLDAADEALASAALRNEPLTQVTLGAAFGGDWPVGSLGELVSVIRGVTYKKEQARSEAGEGYLPIVRATNINGRLTLDDFVYVPAGVVRPEQMLRPGDVVVAASSGSASVVGKSAMLKESWVGSFGAFCAVLRSREGVDPSYVAAFVSSPLVRRRWSSLAAGTNINNLKRDHIVETGIPVPPLSEQRRIVLEVEERLSSIDALRAAIERAQRRSAALRRAVLERAFRGELVPQDPSDEPAEALLARIRAERSSAGALSKTHA